ncbi:MAG TPA: hypothetical protein VM513_06200 [Kofleriaceae bacterium]|nr:hypothetical protein [Kofleriaceae bacterium]
MADADRYRLTPVREARARDERVRTGDLAGAVGDARKTQARVDAAAASVASAREALGRARTGLRARLAAGATAVELVRGERYLERLRRAVEAAIDVHARAAAAHRGQLANVDLARARLARARADKELIERHFARWRIERAKLAERRED